MSNYAKLIGAGLGWALGGPIGAIIGFIAGTIIDSTSAVTTHTYEQEIPRHHTGRGDFAMSLLVLSAAVMKADGVLLKSELDYVKRFFTRQFGTVKTQELMLIFREVLQKNIPVHEVCAQIRYNMQYPLRLQLLHYLFGIAVADSSVSQSEIIILEQISRYLGLSTDDFESIKAMFLKSTDSHYKILEIEKKATDEEVKKAYRKMAIKYHPDKVTHLGDEFQKAAKEKFQKVQEAYEKIKKERGMN